MVQMRLPTYPPNKLPSFMQAEVCQLGTRASGMQTCQSCTSAAGSPTLLQAGHQPRTLGGCCLMLCTTMWGFTALAGMGYQACPADASSSNCTEAQATGTAAGHSCAAAAAGSRK